MRKIFLILALIVLVALAAAVGPSLVGRYQRYQQAETQNAAPIPPAEQPTTAGASSSSPTSAAVASIASASMKAEVNWDVPFTAQAPTGNWDALHEEACEEASVLMAIKYFAGEKIASPDDAEADIQTLVAANEALGFPVDDTADQVVTLIKSRAPSLKAYVLKDPTADDLKKLLSGGSLIIVPAAGQQLGNPYFTAPGPKYHMLLIRGYTKNGYAITNDPGTKRGQQYVYTWDRLLSATHDWNGGDVENGARVVVVVSD